MVPELQTLRTVSGSSMKNLFCERETTMKPTRRIDTSFTPAAWWNNQQISQWIARPMVRREIREKNRSRWDRGRWPRNRILRNRKEGMYIIAVSEEAFSGGEELAKTLAKNLRLPYVDSAALVERTAAAGKDRERLAAALETAPTFFDRSSRHKRTQVLELQAALAEDISNGSMVCYGIAAELLSLDSRRVFRIGIQASHRSRRFRLREQLNIHGASAERYLNTCDQSRRSWLLYLFGAKTGLPMGYDLVIDLERMGLDAACVAVCEMLCDPSRFAAANLASIESFLLSTSIQAALARHPDTAHLDLGVEVQGDLAILRGSVPSMEEIDSIQRVPLPANMKFDFNQVRLDSAGDQSDSISGRWMQSKLNWKPASWDAALSHPAWLSAGVSGTILLILAAMWAPGHWFRPAETHLSSFAGVITDSQCATLHPKAQQTAECVRFCVTMGWAKYVLREGARSLTLTDQQKGGEFAGQKVVATGFLDGATGNLRLRSIHAASR